MYCSSVFRTVSTASNSKHHQDQQDPRPGEQFINELVDGERGNQWNSPTISAQPKSRKKSPDRVDNKQQIGES